MLFDVFMLALCLLILTGGLVGITLLFTLIVKIRHPKWSWRKCARYTTLIS